MSTLNVRLGFLLGSLALMTPLRAQVPDAGRAVQVQPGSRQPMVQESRVALVIGNAAYREMPLQNPVNDARAVAAKLKALGFDVVSRENLPQKQIGATLRAFRTRLQPGSVAVFFYAGHGFQVDGANYLPAVDADIATEDDAPTQCLDVSKVLELMESQKTRLNLVFLDACRNDPFTHGFRSVAGGLAKITPPSGTILSFATRPGSVAADGTGAHGLYTQYLLAAMDEPGVVIEQALKEVFVGVKQASKGKQEPWVEGGIEGDFCFRGAAAPALPPGPALPPPAAADGSIAVELAFWDSIKGSRDPEDFGAYLQKYPAGQFIALARNRMKALAPVSAPGSVAPLPAPVRIAAVAAPAPPRPSPAPLAAPGQDRFGMSFVRIPAGTFTMGDDGADLAERPAHTVRITRPFAMQTTPVTVRQWQAFVAATGYATEAEKEGGIHMDRNTSLGYAPYPEFKPYTWRAPGYFKQDPDHPVLCISWNDSRAFIGWLNQADPGKGYRLPTEAEWEYACRAGTRGARPGELDATAWYGGNSGRATHPVGTKAPNPWGLSDMLGNAVQWCSDWYSATYYAGSPAEDPQGPPSGTIHAARGGNWSYSAEKIRSANRIWQERTFNIQNVGFRVVMAAPEGGSAP